MKKLLTLKDIMRECAGLKLLKEAAREWIRHLNNAETDTLSKDFDFNNQLDDFVAYGYDVDGKWFEDYDNVISFIEWFFDLRDESNIHSKEGSLK